MVFMNDSQLVTKAFSGITVPSLTYYYKIHKRQVYSHFYRSMKKITGFMKSRLQLLITSVGVGT